VDKEQARTHIKETFENPFNKTRFTTFIKNLLNRIEEAPSTYQGQYVPDAYKPYISVLERIGKYSDGEHKIDILIIRLKKETSLERARTMQRNFVAWYLNGSRGGELKDAALVAFISPDEADWRFSLVKMDYRFEQTSTGKTKVKEEFTPARRWSFLVGVNERSHTAQSHLVPILSDDVNNPSLAQLEEAFNIETVTKEFFIKYRELFIRIKEALDKVVENDARIKADFEAKGVDTVNFAKKLLGQVVFLYFLQKKGWFGVERDAEWGTGSKHFLRELFKGSHGKYVNFFNDILEPLFYEALRIDRRHDDDYYSRFNCKIPFLNGGLFDPINNYDWVHTDINLPNELFSNSVRTKEGDIGDGILDIFDRYNFTVREDEPLEKEVAVDPEMLGKVFENLLEVKDRKSKGTYYTPREIVHYMCQESLINYLDTTLNVRCHSYDCHPDHSEGSSLDSSPLARNDKVKMAPNDSPSSNPTVPREDIEEFIRKGEATIQNDLRVVREGRETRDYSYRLPESIRQNAERIDETLESIKICDPAVGSGAFPVGMMHEIVKAREVLTPHIVDEHGRGDSRTAPTTDTERTPYNFKRHCIQESIYGVDIDPSAVDIAKLRLWLSLVVDEEDYERIKPLPNLDYKIVCGNSLLGLPFVSQGMREVEKLKKDLFDETNPRKKKDLREMIDKHLNELLENTGKSLGYKVDFDFRLFFSEVFDEKGGFDVVIANPPYVRQEQIKEYKPWLNNIYKCYTGAADIYVYFYERGLNLLHKQGVLTFITSNKYMRAGYGEKLREFINTSATIKQLIDFGDAPVFEATSYPSIILMQKGRSQNGQVKALSWQREMPVAEFERVVHANSFLIAQKELNTDGWRIESPSVLRLLEKLRKAGRPLGEYVSGRLYYGIKTGLNEALVVDRATRDRLIAEHPSSAEVLKPFLRGRDVKRWRVSFAEQYLIKIESSENKKHPWSERNKAEAERIFAKTYPAIHAHLGKYRKELIQRDDQGKYFWELRSCKYWQEFEQNKIVWGNLAIKPKFAFAEAGLYLNAPATMLISNSKYLLGILNSNVTKYLVSKSAAERQGGFLEYKPMYISPLAIPEQPQNELITITVKQLLDTKRENPKTDVSDLEQQIDQIVYELYGLTPEEIAIVEGRKD
jgi:hypothetical protein